MIERYIFSWLVLSCVLFAGLAKAHRTRVTPTSTAQVEACAAPAVTEVAGTCEANFAHAAD